MTSKILFLGLIPFALIGAGCNKPSQNDVPAPTADSSRWDKTKQGASNAVQETKDASARAWEKTKDATAVAVADVKDATATTVAKTRAAYDSSTNYLGYAYAQKDSFVTSAQADLEKLDFRIKEASDKAAASAESVKADMEPQLKDVREKREILNKKYEHIKQASEDQWEVAKAEYKEAYYDLRKSFHKAWSSLP